MDMNEREKRLRQKQAQRRKNVLIMKCIISLLILIVVFLAVVLIKDAVIPGVKKAGGEHEKTTAGSTGRCGRKRHGRPDREHGRKRQYRGSAAGGGGCDGSPVRL